MLRTLVAPMNSQLSPPFGGSADGCAGATVKSFERSPMTVFAFIAGAAFALIVRTLFRAMADRDARTEILRWA